MFERVVLRGQLAVKQEEPDVEEESPSKLQGLLDFYFDLHPHPVAVHFPVALGIVSAVFVLIYLLFGAHALETSAYYVLWAAVVMTPLAMLSGAISWWVNYGRTMDLRFSLKISLSIILFIVELFAVIVRLRNPTVLVDRTGLGWVYAGALVIAGPLVAILGLIGARLVFPSRSS